MSVEIKGLDKLYKRLGAAATFDRLEKPMQRGVLRFQYRMQDYPPAPRNSRYIRGYGFPGRPTSEKLGQRWTTRIERSASGLVGKVGNNTKYGPWVQSERFQTRFHRRTGWITDERAVREERAAIIADFAREIDRALGE